jgi:hypothetical protein
MEDIVHVIVDYGVLVVIAGIFLFDWVKNKDRVNKTLEQNTSILRELSSTNANISKTLDLLQTSLNTQHDLLVEIEHKIETILMK